MSLQTATLQESVPSVNRNTPIKLGIRREVGGESLITYARIAAEEKITINDDLIIIRNTPNYIIGE